MIHQCDIAIHRCDITIRNAEATGRALGYAVTNDLSAAVQNVLCREYVQTLKAGREAERAAFERGYLRELHIESQDADTEGRT